MDRKELISWLKDKLTHAEDSLARMSTEDDDLASEFHGGRADAFNEVLEKLGFYTTVSYKQTIDK